MAPVDPPGERAARNGLRTWWASPPRTGMQRLINPWEYRHLRAFGLTRIGGGAIGAAAGGLCLAYSAVGWAAFFLAIGLANLACGSWYIHITRAMAAGHVRGS